MINEKTLRGLIRLYCLHLDIEKKNLDWLNSSPREFKELIEQAGRNKDHNLLKKAFSLLYSGRNLQRFHLRDKERLDVIMEKFVSVLISTSPEDIRKNIDKILEAWQEEIDGLGKGSLTEALAFYYPEYFAPWNNTTKWYFELFGWGRPKKYSEVLKRLELLRDIMFQICGKKVTLLEADHFGWWLRDRRIFIQTFKSQPSKNYRQTVNQEVDIKVIKECFSDREQELYNAGFTRAWGRKANEKVPSIGDIVLFGIRKEKKLLSLHASSWAVICDKFDSEYWGKTGRYRKVFLLKPIPAEGITGLDALIKENSEWYSVSMFSNLLELRTTEKLLELLGEVGNSMITSTSQYRLKEEHKKDVNFTGYLFKRGYLYPPYLVSQFYTALKTKGFVILSGLTGTGKTKIAQELAQLIDPTKENLLFLPVRPDWRDSKALLGYYNPLTGEYQRTQLLDFILKAIEDYDKNRENAMPYFVILDEMNLAHVEYYFADFLSVLESGRDENGFTREPIPLHEVEKVEKEGEIPRELKLPPNLYIIGTVNMDETTYSFSPKVLDRAFVVEFHDVDLENYPPQDSESEPSPKTIKALRDSILTDLRGEENKFLARSKEEMNNAVRTLKNNKEENKDYWKVLIELNNALKPYDMHFGYRVVDEIALFFQSAKESQDKGIVEFRDDDEIFDLALLMKVLPKFHGNRKKLEEPLKAILKLCLSENAKTRVQDLGREAVLSILENWEKEKENFRFKHTARKVLRMLRQLYEIGFASFS
ncbi:McrB family protein [Thermococcus nautili]|uniref:GTPase subunit of restriction endonuclease n=1 Tax=Thermococcus nautili TaxID=195522 RepID=W8P707_9EURY|nr:AAA family ATPase [Thermococcus nautili]AHL23315.1 GTPase subunit of restriction endonuclease [Thermococcus nautili]CAI1493050.1 GTPase subunit of restriction endonuclease [Thermococcus nautili]